MPERRAPERWDARFARCWLARSRNPEDGRQIERELVGIGREFASGVLVPGLAKSALERQPSHQPAGDQRDRTSPKISFVLIEPRMGITCAAKPAMSPILSGFDRV